MFLQILMGLLFLGIVVSQAFGAPGQPIEQFFQTIAQRTGRPVDEVRERAIDAIRETGNFTNDDLDRIGRHEDSTLSSARTSEIVKLLQDSPAFRVSTGLESLRLNQVTSQAGAAFDAMATANDPAADFRQATRLAQVAELNLSVLDTTIKALQGRIAQGNDVAASQGRLTKATADRARVVADVAHTRSQLFFATTALLTAKQIAFSMQAEGSQARIVISSGQTLPAELTPAPDFLQSSN